MRTFARLLKYISPYRSQFLLTIFCMIVFSVCNISVMPLVSNISSAVGSKAFGTLNVLIIITVVVFFIKGIFQYGQGYMASFIGQRVVTDMRIQVFKKLQDLSLDFFSGWKTGEIMSRVINDIAVIQNAIIVSSVEIIPQMLTLIGVLGYLLYLNWSLTLIAFLTAPIFVYVISKFGQEMRVIGRNAQKKIADISSLLQENITGARVVKSFTMEKAEITKFVRESEASFDWSMKEAQIDSTQKPIMGFLQVLSVLVVIWFGCMQVINGRLSASDLIAFFAGAVLLIDPVIVISKINTTIQRSIASAERIFEIIDLPLSVIESSSAIDLPPIKNEIAFNEVSFSYSSNEVLKRISLCVKLGETIAIVGPSGSGKSTLANLIPRFYDPKKGSIKIDGIDIRNVTLKSLRDQMAIVPQDTMLFSGTIKDNISYGKPGASTEEIIHAAKSANAHDFIMALPDKYDTEAGERGVLLSGGQRQRIAISRALLRDPKILILDEATSSLDTESERLIQDAMQKLISGRTSFVIAHRLSTVQNATRILVLKDGEIIEEGSHNKLFEMNGLYRRLYDLQFGAGRDIQ